MNGYIRSHTEDIVMIIMYKISGTRRVVGLILFMLAFVLASHSFAYMAYFKHSYLGSMTNAGVMDTTTGTWANASCVVEVMDVGANGRYDAPGSTGYDDVILGGGKIITPLGRFSVSADVTIGHQVYVRVWNAASESLATKFGVSEVTTVPSISLPPPANWGYDVGPGGVWTNGLTYGSDMPALTI